MIPGPTWGSPFPVFRTSSVCTVRNTNLVVNGSLFLFSECAVNYMVESVGMLLEKGAWPWTSTTRS